MRNVNLLIAGIALAMFACLPGCGGGGSPDGDTDVDGDTAVDGDAEIDGDTGPDIAALLADGKRLLETGQANEARAVFAEALLLAPDDPQANFGMGFAESQTTLELLFAILDVILQLGTPEPPVDTPVARTEPPGSQSEWLARELDRVLSEIDGLLASASARYAKTLAAADFVWQIDDRLPVWLGIRQTAWMTGTIDRNGVLMLDGICRITRGLFTFLTAHDFNGQIGRLVVWFMGGGEDELGVPAVLGQVAGLLDTSPSFLGLNPLSGRQRLDGLRQSNALALEGVRAAADALSAAYDAGEPMDGRVFYLLHDKRRGEKFLAAHVWKQGEDGPLLQEVKIIDLLDLPQIDALAGSYRQGGVVPVDEAVLPALSSALALAAGYGLIDRIGFELGLGDSITPKVVLSLLKSIIPSGLGLDFGAWHDDPTLLRGMLPAWDDDGLLFEWECPAETADDGFPDGSGGLLCAGSGEALVDGPHFAGTQYEMEADGTPSAAPYAAFQDPTFGGLLFVKDGAGWAPADQTAANAALGQAIDNIFSFVGSRR